MSHSYPLLLAAVLTYGVAGVTAIPLAEKSGSQGWHHASLIPTDLDRHNVCGFEGNSDLYGLGIRLGVYFQLSSSFLANHYHRDIMKDTWDAVGQPCHALN
jgi:hypothetical protein